MKGSDVTPEQLRHAEEFVMNSALRGYEGPVVVIAKENLFRLVAWYGAIRSASGNGPDALGPLLTGDELSTVPSTVPEEGSV